VNPKTWKDYKFKETPADIKKLISKLDKYSKMSTQAMQKEEFLLAREFAGGDYRDSCLFDPSAKTLFLNSSDANFVPNFQALKSCYST
jgi:hypothetical protein